MGGRVYFGSQSNTLHHVRKSRLGGMLVLETDHNPRKGNFWIHVIIFFNFLYLCDSDNQSTPKPCIINTSNDFFIWRLKLIWHLQSSFLQLSFIAIMSEMVVPLKRSLYPSIFSFSLSFLELQIPLFHFKAFSFKMNGKGHRRFCRVV